MGHFTITLPDNQQGDVRWGTIRKKTLLINLFKKNRPDNEIRKGYIVNLGSNTEELKEYRLLKSKEGNWISEDLPGFQVSPSDQISISIKKAIDDYEQQH